MHSYDGATVAALAARRLLPRDFLWIVARDRSTGDPVSVGFWSDVSNVSALVLDPDTDAPVSRDFYGAGGLIQIDDIPAVASVTIQQISIRMSQLDEMVEQAVRLYDIKQARVEVYTGMLDPDSRRMVAPAICRFVGFVDTVNIETPSENAEGGVTIACSSHTQEMTRANPATRSHEDQKIRSSTDQFFVDAAVCGEWQHYWGPKPGKVEAKKGLFGWGGFLGIF
jgi:hypothetical protein